MAERTPRRCAVPFDPFFFEDRARGGHTFDLPDTFRLIYETNHWGAAQKSGAGAALEQTQTLLDGLAALIRELRVSTILDVPCGDLAWIRHLNVAGLSYVGGDIVPEVIATNRAQFAGSRTFRVLDLTRDELPAADLLLCRDCLVHLSYADARAALANVSRSAITYFLSTTFPDCAENEEIVTGDWRTINLELAPFSLPTPMRLICEKCSEGDGRFSDKSLGLWRVDQLR